MNDQYLFHHTCFEKEHFLKELIVMNDHQIDFQTIDHSSRIQFKAPASGHFEMEILIQETDFDRANDILESLNTYGN